MWGGGGVALLKGRRYIEKVQLKKLREFNQSISA